TTPVRASASRVRRRNTGSRRAKCRRALSNTVWSIELVYEGEPRTGLGADSRFSRPTVGMECSAYLLSFGPPCGFSKYSPTQLRDQVLEMTKVGTSRQRCWEL